MLVLKRIEMCEMLKDEEVVKMIDKMLEDDQTFDSYCEMLKGNISLSVQWKGNDIGYFICKDTNTDGRKEIHIFFYPSMRRYTLQALSAIQKYFKERGLGLYTTVTGDVEYVVRIGEMLGFYITHISRDVVKKGGKTFHLYHLENTFY